MTKFEKEKVINILNKVCPMELMLLGPNNIEKAFIHSEEKVQDSIEILSEKGDSFDFSEAILLVINIIGAIKTIYEIRNLSPKKKDIRKSLKEYLDKKNAKITEDKIDQLINEIINEE